MLFRSNYLISTRQNALDTLEVKDISVPKPDSINWFFDPQTVIIDNSMFAPLIRYNQQGNYPVSMTAWFGGCDFKDDKIIAINPYDPNVVNNYINHLGIDTVVVSPNPNKGSFTLQVKLFMKQRLRVNIYSISGQLLWNKQWDYTNQVQEQVTLPSTINNGILFLKAVTDNDARDVQIMIAK